MAAFAVDSVAATEGFGNSQGLRQGMHEAHQISTILTRDVAGRIAASGFSIDMFPMIPSRVVRGLLPLWRRHAAAVAALACLALLILTQVFAPAGRIDVAEWSPGRWNANSPVTSLAVLKAKVRFGEHQAHPYF
ncbi:MULTISPECIES: hypothetical protein [unclassified Variovorax]|uniref:hypothetical protein n=1 Tax=unclassified Variovorax TaxID=663243 RepID=UPI003F45B92F